MNIDAQVLDVLSNAVASENTLKLTGQLDRKLYEATNKVLLAAGGKWNRKSQAHLFDGDVSEIMDAIILTGKVTCKKSELGYFPTPKAVVDRLIELADLMPHMSVLEPSAGRGAIAEEIVKIAPDVCCYEIDPDNVAALLKKEISSVTGDFLSIEPSGNFDRVIMNPPFAKQSDIRHVLHAYKFLKPGGRLISVVALGVEFRTNKITSNFRQFIADHSGETEALPEGSFSESGTSVNTVIVTLNA